MTLSIVEAVGRIKAEVAKCLTAESIERVCRDCGHRWRQREVGPVQTVWTFLTQILHGNTACAPRHPSSRFELLRRSLLSSSDTPAAGGLGAVAPANQPRSSPDVLPANVAWPSDIPGGRFDVLDARHAAAAGQIRSAGPAVGRLWFSRRPLADAVQCAQWFVDQAADGPVADARHGPSGAVASGIGRRRHPGWRYGLHLLRAFGPLAPAEFAWHVSRWSAAIG